MRLLFASTLAAVASTASPSARAQQTAASGEAAPAPYDLPYALRSTSASTSVRAETAYGLDAGRSSTIVQYLTASYAPIEHLSLFARGGWVDFLPNAGSASSAMTNVALGALWAGDLSPGLRYSAAIGSGLPLGQGGGDAPDPGEAAAIAAGNLARSRYEGSTMFSPNDLALFVGGDLAWVNGGWTVQAEATLFQLFRVRGGDTDPATGKPWDPDGSKTSLDLAAHAGYFVIPQLSVGIEVRDQTFLSTPAAVQSGALGRTWLTVGGGVRAHVRLAGHAWLRPGLAFFQPLNDALLRPDRPASSYHIVQLDLPVSF